LNTVISTRPITSQIAFEGFALEHLGEENTLRLQDLAAKRDRLQEELRRARLVHERHAGDVGHHVREHDVGLAAEGRLQVEAAKVPVQGVHAGERRQLQQIHGNHLAAGLHPLGRDLRPAARRRAEVEHGHPGLKMRSLRSISRSLYAARER
jgi:hypothetical protein